MKNKSAKRDGKISVSSKNLFCEYTQIKLSDEHLKNILSHVYEKARKDSDCFKVYKYYGVFLSVFLTLFLSLLTSEFRGFLGLSGAVIATCARVLCAGCFIAWIVLSTWNTKNRNSDMNQERDDAVKEALNEVQERVK